MAITIPIVTTPIGAGSSFVCGYNPIIYTLQFDLTGAPAGYYNLKGYLNIYDHRAADAIIATKRAAAILSGGITTASFNIAPEARGRFQSINHVVSPNEYAHDVGGLSCDLIIGYGFTYRDVNGVLQTSNEILITDHIRPTRAVAQIGESKNMVAYQFSPIKFLSDFETIYIWDYKGMVLPAEVDFIMPSDLGGFPIIIATSAGGAIGIAPGDKYHEIYHTITKSVWNGCALFIRDVYNPAVHSELKPCKVKTVPSNPFFVRWLNRRSGFDYWCFSKRQTRELQTGEMKVLKNYVEDPETAAGTHTKIDMAEVDRFMVGATNLIPNDWEVVCRMGSSPIVQWYSIAKGVWYNVIAEASRNQIMNDKPAGKLEFNILMPEPNLQF